MRQTFESLISFSTQDDYKYFEPLANTDIDEWDLKGALSMNSDEGDELEVIKGVLKKNRFDTIVAREDYDDQDQESLEVDIFLGRQSLIEVTRSFLGSKPAKGDLLFSFFKDREQVNERINRIIKHKLCYVYRLFDMSVPMVTLTVYNNGQFVHSQETELDPNHSWDSSS